MGAPSTPTLALVRTAILVPVRRASVPHQLKARDDYYLAAYYDAGTPRIVPCVPWCLDASRPLSFAHLSRAIALLDRFFLFAADWVIRSSVLSADARFILVGLSVVAAHEASGYERIWKGLSNVEAHSTKIRDMFQRRQRT